MRRFLLMMKMLRFLLIMTVAASALHAASMTSASCTLGSVTQTETDTNFSSCVIRDAMDFRIGHAEAQASDFFSGGQAFVVVTALADGMLQLGEGSASASATDSQSFASAGPERLGFIQFDVFLAYTGEAERVSTAVLTDGAHDYTFGLAFVGPIPPIFCDPGHCRYTGTLPFDLGSTFQVSASTSARISVVCGPCPFNESFISFSLLEADGTTPVPFAVATPEPSTAALLLFGLATFAWRYARKRVARN